MSKPDTGTPTRRRASVLPSPRALLLVVLAVALGAGAFAVLWFNDRDDYEFYRAEGTPPTAAPPIYEPLPVPSSGEGLSGLELTGGPADIAGEPGDVAAPAAPPEPQAAEPPAAPPPVASAGPDRAPRPLAGQTPPPRYPVAELRRGRGGTVVLRVEVDASGRASSVTVANSSRSRQLDRAAVDAVRRWRFEPAILNGQPSPGVVTVPVDFTPER